MPGTGTAAPAANSRAIAAVTPSPAIAVARASRARQRLPRSARSAGLSLSPIALAEARARYATAAVAAGPKTWYRRDPRNPRPTGESCLRVSTRIVTAALPGRCERPRRAIRVPATVEEEQCRACCSGRSRLAQVARSGRLCGSGARLLMLLKRWACHRDFVVVNDVGVCGRFSSGPPYARSGKPMMRGAAAGPGPGGCSRRWRWSCLTVGGK